MKKFVSKIKKGCHRFMTGKSGFSLVELIVVIAIMAVMAAVLAPALLGYVERSRAQKDNSGMDEVVNSIQLSLADQDVYDEMLKYSAEQYSCYIDSDSPDEANKIDIKAGKYYMYSDEERQLDETVYRLDGVMRGVTITFAPDAASSNKATFDLIKGHINKYLPSGKKTYGGLTGAAASPKLADIPESELYNSLRATIGDKIAISSQTYRNSEYTIFISMGTTGGQEAAAQDAIKVWGQFSGTNLPEGTSVAGNTATGSNEFKEPTNGGGAPVVTLPAKGKTLEEYTWAEVQQIVQAGKATEYGFAVGGTKTLSINGATKTATIIGLNHDGSNTATFMIVSSGGIGYHVMNTDYTNAGGWEDSEMREWLNGNIYNSMSNKDYIKTVTKMTNNIGYNGNSVTGTQDKVFLLSPKEAGVEWQMADSNYWNWSGYPGMNALNSEGSTYTWFATNTVGDYFWLRSPRSDIDDVFFDYGYGGLGSGIASYGVTVCPAFVIG